MIKILFSIALSSFSAACFSQSYSSYFTGDTTNVLVQPTAGIFLAGGAGDHDNAMKWFLERANGGDVLVIRASGADGYNDYFYSDLGIDVNSVETIVFNNSSAADDSYVIAQIENAEAIFMAGGDQSDYINYWKDTPVEDALNNHINVKQGVIGGTSAGMAVQGGHYFSADNGSAYSSEALENPYNTFMTIGHQDFLQHTVLQHVITDTHYDDPDRRGRHATFLSRILQDGFPMALGIASNEWVAVCIDELGIAYVFGEWPDYQEYAYFLRPGCEAPIGPEICSVNQPLTWNRNEKALYVFKATGTLQGTSTFDLNDWTTAEGGSWQEWWIEGGVFNVNENSIGPDCAITTEVSESPFKTAISFRAFPSPCDEKMVIETTRESFGFDLTIYDAMGKYIANYPITSFKTELKTTALSNGFYFLKCGSTIQKFTVTHEE